VLSQVQKKENQREKVLRSIAGKSMIGKMMFLFERGVVNSFIYAGRSILK